MNNRLEQIISLNNSAKSQLNHILKCGHSDTATSIFTRATSSFLRECENQKIENYPNAIKEFYQLCMDTLNVLHEIDTPIKDAEERLEYKNKIDKIFQQFVDFVFFK